MVWDIRAGVDDGARKGDTCASHACGHNLCTPPEFVFTFCVLPPQGTPPITSLCVLWLVTYTRFLYTRFLLTIVVLGCTMCSAVKDRAKTPHTRSVGGLPVQTGWRRSASVYAGVGVLISARALPIAYRD